MIPNKQLSKNFGLSEFLTSQTAVRNNFLEQFQPPDSVIDNLQELVTNVLQPLRDLLPDGVIHISSGYRCPRDNQAVGGVSNSQHVLGMAADCQYIENGVTMNMKLHNTLINSKLVWDQCIREFGTEINPAWIHISYNSNGNERKMDFKIG